MEKVNELFEKIAYDLRIRNERQLLIERLTDLCEQYEHACKDVFVASGLDPDKHWETFLSDSETGIFKSLALLQSIKNKESKNE